MNNYCMIQNSKTFAFSAENPTGVRAGGSQGGDCTKLRPTVTIPAGETVTLVDAAGPGVIQHMWFTGYVGHHFIIRMYWDDQEYPSVEAPLSAFFGCAYDENFVDRDGKYPVLNSATQADHAKIMVERSPKHCRTAACCCYSGNYFNDTIII